MIFSANNFHGVLCARERAVSFRVACFPFSCRLFSLTRANVRKKHKHPTMPKIPITTRKPRASFPLPISCTMVRAVADTMVEPKNAKNFLQVARTVLSFTSSVIAGRMDASGMFTTVYIKDKNM